MAEKKAKTPPTLEEQRDKLERKVRRLEGQVMRLEVSAKVDAEHREKERKELREEMWRYRRFIIEQLREPLPRLVRDFIWDPRQLAHFKEYPRASVACGQAESDLIDCLVEAAEPHAIRDYERHLRAPCPLCGSEPMGPYTTGGFALPNGLEMHLTGARSARQCFVMEVIRAEAREDAASTLANPQYTQMRLEKAVAKDPAAAGKTSKPLVPGVQPCAAERNLPEEQVTLWEINSSGDSSGGPYDVRAPEKTAWVCGTRVHAGYARERWMTALRWRALPEGTRLWVSFGREESGGLLMAPILNRADEEAPTVPAWDRRAQKWRASERIVVDLVEGFYEYEWDARRKAEAGSSEPE